MRKGGKIDVFMKKINLNLDFLQRSEQESNFGKGKK